MLEGFVRSVYTLMDIPGFGWIYPTAKKMGLVHLLHVVQSKTDRHREEKCKPFNEFYARHEQDFQRLSGMLEDEMSRRTLAGVLAYRRTMDIDALKGLVVQPQYFQKDIFGPVKDEVFVDGGAYDGDTVKGFIKNFGGVQENICLGT